MKIRRKVAFLREKAASHAARAIARAFAVRNRPFGQLDRSIVPNYVLYELLAASLPVPSVALVLVSTAIIGRVTE